MARSGRFNYIMESNDGLVCLSVYLRLQSINQSVNEIVDITRGRRRRIGTRKKSEIFHS